MEKINQISEEIIEYLNPDIVLTPYFANYELKVKTGQELNKEQVILEKNEQKVLSPVSGTIAGAKKAFVCNGEETPCILIQNDYKEQVNTRKASKRKVNNIPKADLIKALKDYGTPNMYRHNEFLEKAFSKKDYETLIVSGVDLEPSFYSDSFTIRDYKDEILETIDLLIDTLNIKKCYLVLRNNDDQNIVKYTEYLGIFPKIKLKLVSSTYPSGLEHLLKQEILNNKEIENTLFLGCQNIIAIYDAIKRKRPITEKYITITGPVVKVPRVIKVKFGSYVENLIKNVVELNSNDNIAYYSNGYFSGIEMNLSNLFVTPFMSGIYITKKIVTTASECINCGKCYERCPMGINPKYIMENINDIEKLKETKINNCLNCGFCTYNCPSKIKLKEFIKRGTNEIK